MEYKNELRNKTILLIYYLNKVYGRTFLQKFFFLLKNEQERDMKVRFTKYHYGPFSMDIVNITNQLIIEGKVIEKGLKCKKSEGHYYELSENGEKEAKKIESKTNIHELKEFKMFCEKYKNYSPTELLKLVYIKYPEWTMKSGNNEVLEKIANQLERIADVLEKSYVEVREVLNELY